MKLPSVVPILLFAVIVLPEASSAYADSDDPLSSYQVTLGIAVNAIDFDVSDEGSSSPKGTLSEDFSYSPFMALISPYKYLGESHWGMFMEYSFSGFQLDRQIVNDKSGELADLGTSVKGYYAFATPTLFYSFNAKKTRGSFDQKIIAGIGIGLGYLDASGDIIFTETTQERFNIDVSGAALAISIFADYQAGDFATRISGGLTSLTEGGMDYDAFGFTWAFSYIFEL
jgi:hypothetical protein